MKKVIFLLIVLISVFSCQPTDQTEQSGQTDEEYQTAVKEEITQINKLYLEAWENKDLDSTMFFLDEGFINMFAFGLTDTKEQSRVAWKDVFDTYSIQDVEFKNVELILDENYAFQTLLFEQKWITEDKQDTTFFDMRGMTVFKKQLDDSWKMYRLIGQQ